MQCDKVVLATRNTGKIEEFAQLLGRLGVTVVGLNEFENLPEIEETGSTFAENALIKARAIADATGLVSIADDSGLVVAALEGEPGVRSSRYADDFEYLPGETKDQRNIRKLLKAMRGLEIQDRYAHFETVIAVAAPHGPEMTVGGQWQGTILESPLGANGFGYDPVFWDPDLKKSAAQLKAVEKNAVSHRGRAVAALIREWPAFIAKIQTL